MRRSGTFLPIAVTVMALVACADTITTPTPQQPLEPDIRPVANVFEPWNLSMTEEQIMSLPIKNEQSPEELEERSNLNMHANWSAVWFDGMDRKIVRTHGAGEYSNANRARAWMELAAWHTDVGSDASPKGPTLKVVLSPMWVPVGNWGYYAKSSGYWSMDSYNGAPVDTVPDRCHHEARLVVAVRASLFEREPDGTQFGWTLYEDSKNDYKTFPAKQGENCSAEAEQYPSSEPCDIAGTSLIESCPSGLEEYDMGYISWAHGPQPGVPDYGNWYREVTHYYMTTIYGTFPTGQVNYGPWQYRGVFAPISMIVGPAQPATTDPRASRVQLVVKERAGDVARVSVRNGHGPVKVEIRRSALTAETLAAAFDGVIQALTHKQTERSTGLTLVYSTMPPMRPVKDGDRAWLENVIARARSRPRAIEVNVKQRPAN